MAIKDIATGGLGKLKKFAVISTGIFMVLVMLKASIDANREKSIRPFLTGVGERILSADSYIYYQMKDLKENPDKLYFQAKLEKIQQQFGSDPNRYQLEMIKVQTNWEKFKFFMGKIWVYIDLLLSIWFLITIVYLIYLFVDKIISPFTFLGNAITVAIIYILLTTLFTFTLYDPNNFGNKNYKDLNIKTQIQLLNPTKGVVELIMQVPFLINVGYERFVVPIDTARASENTIISNTAKVFS